VREWRRERERRRGWLKWMERVRGLREGKGVSKRQRRGEKEGERERERERDRRDEPVSLNDDRVVAAVVCDIY